MSNSFFYLKQIRYEVAMQRSLKTWQPGPVLYGDGCPHCGSLLYANYGTDNGKQHYRCHECRRRFNEREQFQCHCEIPGKIPQCQDCPGFQAFVKVLRQQTDALRGHTIEELERLK